jgi:hypothetical protein
MGTQSAWIVNWEGRLFTDWHLSATLQSLSVSNEKGTSSSVVVLSGSILDLGDAISSDNLVNLLTSPATTQSSDASNTLWQQTVPSTVTSSFRLKQCAVNLVLGGNVETFGVGAQVEWGSSGQGFGVITIQKVNPPPTTGSPWGFALAVGVSNFRFTDLVADSSLAQSIDNALVSYLIEYMHETKLTVAQNIDEVSLLVFRNPGNMDLSRISQLVTNAGSCNLLPNESATLPLQNLDGSSSLEFTEGAALFATFSFGSAKPGSVTDNLNTITNSKLSDVKIMGYFGKSGSNASVIIFTASISTIQLFSSVTLKQVLLTYAPAASPTVSKAQDQTSGPSKTQDSDPNKNQNSAQSGKLVNTFTLSADCSIEFSSDSSWTIHGELQVTNSDAKLSAALTTGTLTLSETLGLEISNIQFTVDYVLSSAPDSGASPASQGQQVSHAPKFNMDLSGQAKIGPITAVASVVFDTEIPGVLVVQVPGELNVSDLFNQIFDANIPSDVLDISFSQFLMYYAWRNVASAPAEVKPSNGSYATGFHAEAHASIYGMFIYLIRINNGTER